MRAVWRASERTVFVEDIDAIARVLPSARRVRFSFPPVTEESRFGPELVSEMSIEFGKGRVLTVPGYMLWKFRDMIPQQLGDEESGWFDTNEFSEEHGSALMNRVLQAHDACCREGSSSEIFGLGRRMLKEVTIDLKQREVHRMERPRLSKGVLEELSNRLTSEVADRRRVHWQAIGALAHEEMSSKRLTLGFAPVGGGMLGRVKEYSDWPKPESMKPQEFYKSLSQRTHENSPSQMQQFDLVKRALGECGRKLVERYLRQMQTEDPGFFEKLSLDLKCKEGSGPARVAAALEKSNAAFLAWELMHIEVTRTLRRTASMADVVSMRHARSWSQHLDDEVEEDGDGLGGDARPTARRARRVFRLVTRLYVFPSKVTSPEDLPYVSHTGVDFERLREELQNTFSYGAPVRIRVANDTIDQVTMHMRPRSELHCNDFGALLLAQSKKSRDSVIGVRTAWRPLHHLKDRDHCPPPSIVMFVVEADNFEDAMTWLDQSRGVVGQEMAMDFLYDKKKKGQVGKLPPVLQKTLEGIFEVKYDGTCVLERSVMDKAPSWVRKEE